MAHSATTDLWKIDQKAAIQIAEDLWSRRRTYRLPVRWVVRFFMQQGALPNYVDVMDPGLPTDATVLGVFLEPYRQCLLVTVCHPSFEPVSDGDVGPEQSLIERWVRRALATESELNDRTRILFEQWDGMEAPEENGKAPGDGRLMQDGLVDESTG